jgi:hypothetical protein
MYNVSDAYKTAVKAFDRRWRLTVKLNNPYRNNTDLTLADDDIQLGSVRFSEAIMPTDAFALGGAVLSEFEMAIINNNGAYDEIQLEGTTIEPVVELFCGYDDDVEIWEAVPLGIFIIDEAKNNHDVLAIKAFDQLSKADTPYVQPPDTEYPADVLMLFMWACEQCGIELGDLSGVINDDYEISSQPDEKPSCRDIINWTAQIMGSWARMDRSGMIELIPAYTHNPKNVSEAIIDGNTDNASGGNFTNYQCYAYDGGVFIASDVDFTTDPESRYDFSLDGGNLIITGIQYEADSAIYLAGTDKYAIDLSGNKLIESSPAAVLNLVYAGLLEYTYAPYTASWIGDPAVQAGDIVEHIDRAGKTYRSIVAESKYAYRGKATITAGGKSESTNKYRR